MVSIVCMYELCDRDRVGKYSATAFLNELFAEAINPRYWIFICFVFPCNQGASEVQCGKS